VKVAEEARLCEVSWCGYWQRSNLESPHWEDAPTVHGQVGSNKKSWFIHALSHYYALRVILRKPPLTSSELLRQTLEWTTLKIRCHNAMLCQVHRCCIKQAPPYLCSKFTTNSNLNYARTRGSDKLHLPRPRTKLWVSRSCAF